MNFITSYCHLNDDSCLVNGKEIVYRDKDSPESWFKQLYKYQGAAYPKFHKMDMLSQAGFILSELIKRDQPANIASYGDDEIAMVFANRFSSADSDLRFKRSYEEDGTPSPALFVYTLPNIVLGEIAIFNKWYGENIFAVLPKFDPDFFIGYADSLMSAGGSKAVLCGWLGIGEGKLDIFLFFVERQGPTESAFTLENLRRVAGGSLM